jgi:hypothetical protein
LSLTVGSSLELAPPGGARRGNQVSGTTRPRVPDPGGFRPMACPRVASCRVRSWCRFGILQTSEAPPPVSKDRDGKFGEVSGNRALGFSHLSCRASTHARDCAGPSSFDLARAETDWHPRRGCIRSSQRLTFLNRSRFSSPAATPMGMQGQGRRRTVKKVIGGLFCVFFSSKRVQGNPGILH